MLFGTFVPFLFFGAILRGVLLPLIIARDIREHPLGALGNEGIVVLRRKGEDIRLPLNDDL